jgi:hypothetical protein
MYSVLPAKKNYLIGYKEWALTAMSSALLAQNFSFGYLTQA